MACQNFTEMSPDSSPINVGYTSASYNNSTLTNQNPKIPIPNVDTSDLQNMMKKYPQKNLDFDLNLNFGIPVPAKDALEKVTEAARNDLGQGQSLGQNSFTMDNIISSKLNTGSKQNLEQNPWTLNYDHLASNLQNQSNSFNFLSNQNHQQPPLNEPATIPPPLLQPNTQTHNFEDIGFNNGHSLPGHNMTHGPNSGLPLTSLNSLNNLGLSHNPSHGYDPISSQNLLTSNYDNLNLNTGMNGFASSDHIPNGHNLQTSLSNENFNFTALNDVNSSFFRDGGEGGRYL